MKKTLLAVVFCAITLAAIADTGPTLSFVVLWPDNTITVHIETGTHGVMQPGIVSQTYVNGVLTCESFFDCPIYPPGNNIMLGDQNHGCPQACNTNYTFRVRGSNGYIWSNWLAVHTGACNSF